MNRIIIDLDRFTDTKEFHLWLKEKCQFPDYYGCNLDALYDCLCESPHFEFYIQPSKYYPDYLKRLVKTIMDAKCDIYFYVHS